MCERDRKRADAAPPQSNCGRGGRVQSANRVGDRNRNASGAARPTGEAGVSRKLSVFGDSPLERAEADARRQAQLSVCRDQSSELAKYQCCCASHPWRCDRCLSICKDVAQCFTAEEIDDAFKLMDGRTSSVAQRNVFAEKLRDLGAPVVPILYMSRSGIVLDGRENEHASCDWRGMHRG